MCARACVFSRSHSKAGQLDSFEYFGLGPMKTDILITDSLTAVLSAGGSFFLLLQYSQPHLDTL